MSSAMAGQSSWCGNGRQSYGQAAAPDQVWLAARGVVAVPSHVVGHFSVSPPYLRCVTVASRLRHSPMMRKMTVRSRTSAPRDVALPRGCGGK